MEAAVPEVAAATMVTRYGRRCGSCLAESGFRESSAVLCVSSEAILLRGMLQLPAGVEQMGRRALLRIYFYFNSVKTKRIPINDITPSMSLLPSAPSS